MTKQNYLFKKFSQTETSTSNNEHFFICGEDDPWDVVLRQFAMFLDQSGYIGVYEAVDVMLEEHSADKWDTFTGQFDGQMDLFEDKDEGR